MGIFDGCLLASDVDGTLMASGYLPEINREKIKFFISEGGKFSISTGRSAEALGQLFKIFDKDLVSYSIVLNGGMIYDFKEEKVVYDTSVSQRVKEFTKYIAETDKDMGIEVHLGGKTYVLNRNAESDLHEEYEELKPHYVSYTDIKDLVWNKVLMASLCENLRDKLKEKAIEFGLDPREILETCAEIEGKKRMDLEFLPIGASKGTALNRLGEIYKVKPGGLFAIGDYYNDASMLSQADVSCATADAPSDLKETVNFVSTSCREGAVADFIEYLKNNSGGKF